MPAFSPSSFANAKLPDVRKVDPGSAGVVAKLTSWVHEGTQPISATQNFTAGVPWLNEHPFYYATSATPRVRVALTSWLSAQQQPLLQSVPVDPVWHGDASSDASLSILDPDRDTLYDLWQFHHAADGSVSAQGAGIMRPYKTGLGNWSDVCHLPESLVLGSQWGVQASGFAHLAGLVTVRQLMNGQLENATSLAVPWAKQDWFSAPAQRTDGKDSTSSAIPYGGRLCLPLAFDMDAYTTARRKTGGNPSYTPSKFTRMVAEAWRVYGAFPVDQSGQGVAINVESQSSWKLANPGQPWPYTTPGPIFTHAWSDEMRLLPWDALQLLQCDWRRRN